MMKVASSSMVQPETLRAMARPSVLQEKTAVASAKATISSLGKTLSEGDYRNVNRELVAEIMTGKSLRDIRYSDLFSKPKSYEIRCCFAGKDYLDFIRSSPEVSMLDGSGNPNWDMPMDYIGRHELNLAFMTATGAEQHYIDFERHLLSLYKSFEP